jgi:hypothetical protein
VARFNVRFVCELGMRGSTTEEGKKKDMAFNPL